MANELKFGSPIVVGSLNADPVTAYEGEIYYNTSMNALRLYSNGAWGDSGGSGGANTNLSNLTSPVAVNQNILFGSNTLVLGDPAGVGSPHQVFVGQSNIVATYPFNSATYPGFSFIGDNNDLVATVGSTNTTIPSIPHQAVIGFATSYGNEFNAFSTTGFWAKTGSLDLSFVTTQINNYPGTQSIIRVNFQEDGTLGVVSPSGANIEFAQTTTPGNPAASFDRLYFKSDDNAYILNSAGTERQLATVGLAGTWQKHTVTYANLASSSTQNNFTVVTLPAGAVIHAVFLNVTASFNGGTLQDYQITLGNINDEASYVTQTDVFSFTGLTPYTELNSLNSISATTTVNLYAQGYGGALSQATQGSVDVYLLTSVVG